MPRIRTVKPEFFQHEILSSLDATTHLFALGLVCYADDYGYFNANPGLVKGIVFPLRGEVKNIGEMLDELRKIGYVQLGIGKDGRKYGRIVNFDKHQRVSHPTKSLISPLSITWEPLVNPPENFVNPPETFRPEGKGMERKGREGRDDSPALDRGSVLEFAKGIINELQMPLTRFFVESVEASIVAKMKAGMTDEEAASFILERALAYKARGNMPSKNWFEAAGYDKPSEKPKPKPEVPLYITERHKLEAMGIKIEQGVAPSKYREMLKTKAASNVN